MEKKVFLSRGLIRHECLALLAERTVYEISSSISRELITNLNAFRRLSSSLKYLI